MSLSLYYVGDAGRYYPTLGLEPVNGQSYDLGADPGDGRWSTSPSAPASPAAPAAEVPAGVTA